MADTVRSSSRFRLNNQRSAYLEGIGILVETPLLYWKEIPKFSYSWLDRFKKRYGIKERRHYREGASAQVDEDSEKAIEEIRAVVREYGPDLTYNIDETGYY